MKKPAIPDTQGMDAQLRKVLDPIKENIEILTARRGTPISQLTANPSVADIATKLNALLALLQDSSPSAASGVPSAIATPSPTGTFGTLTVTAIAGAAASFLFASGDVKSSASSAVQDGWLACDGTSYTTAAQPALFTSIGYVWGGSGLNFNVPDFRGRTLIGDGTGTALTARTVGQHTIGEETHLLTTPEMPSHVHAASAGSFQISAAGIANQFLPGAGTPNYVAPNTAATGGGGAHNNMQPSAVIHWLIKT
jgi:microcystin-dependent protein